MTFFQNSICEHGNDPRFCPHLHFNYQKIELRKFFVRICKKDIGHLTGVPLSWFGKLVPICEECEIITTVENND